MSGLWILLFMLALTALALWLAGVRKVAMTAALGAMTFGAAAYVVQGRPDLGGDPRRAGESAIGLPLQGARTMLFGNFAGNESWHVMAESLAARGKLEDAANIMAASVREHPKDVSLWVGLGNALVDQAGVLTPPARFAYAEAQRLSKKHPAPAFFLGLAELRSDNPEEAIRIWQALLAETPERAPYRALILDGLNAIGSDATSPTPTNS